MTGYGKSKIETNYLEVEIEVKSVNHRFIDINIKAPQIFQKFDVFFRNIIKQKLKRGSVSLFLNIFKKPVRQNAAVINEASVSFYVEQLIKIAEKNGFEPAINWDTLLKFPDVLETDSKDEDEEIKNILLKGVKKALDNLIKYREKEGLTIGRGFYRQNQNL